MTQRDEALTHLILARRSTYYCLNAEHNLNARLRRIVQAAQPVWPDSKRSNIKLRNIFLSFGYTADLANLMADSAAEAAEEIYLRAMASPIGCLTAPGNETWPFKRPAVFLG